jgi:hypothetical protein
MWSAIDLLTGNLRRQARHSTFLPCYHLSLMSVPESAHNSSSRCQSVRIPLIVTGDSGRT